MAFKKLLNSVLSTLTDCVRQTGTAQLARWCEWFLNIDSVILVNKERLIYRKKENLKLFLLKSLLISIEYGYVQGA